MRQGKHYNKRLPFPSPASLSYMSPCKLHSEALTIRLLPLQGDCHACAHLLASCLPRLPEELTYQSLQSYAHANGTCALLSCPKMSALCFIKVSS